MKKLLFLMLVILSTSFIAKGQNIQKPDSLPAMVYDTILPFGLTEEKIIDLFSSAEIIPFWERVEGGFVKKAIYKDGNWEISFTSNVVKNRNDKKIKEIYQFSINSEDVPLITDVVSEFTIKIKRDIAVHQKLQAAMLKLLRGDP